MASILFLGESRVGKTSIIRQFCTGTFNSSEPPTIGIECRKKLLDPRPGSEGGAGMRVALWEVSGAKRYRQMVRNRVKGCLFVAIVCAADDEQSARTLNEWRDLILSADENAMIVVVLNKMDRAAPHISAPEASAASSDASATPPATTTVEKTVEEWCGEETPLIKITAFERFSVEDKLLEIVDYALMVRSGKSEKDVKKKFIKGSGFKRVTQSTPLLNANGDQKNGYGKDNSGSGCCCCCTIL